MTTNIWQKGSGDTLNSPPLTEMDGEEGIMHFSCLSLTLPESKQLRYVGKLFFLEVLCYVNKQSFSN